MLPRVANSPRLSRGPTLIVAALLLATTRAASVAAEEPGGRPAPRVTLDLLVQRRHESRGEQLLSAAMMPLRNEDKVRVRATATKPMVLYLVWYDETGAPTLLAPKPEQEHLPTASHEDPPLTTNPDDQYWHKLGGKPGREIVLLGARRSRLPEAIWTAFARMHVEPRERPLKELAKDVTGTAVAQRSVKRTEVSPLGKRVEPLKLPARAVLHLAKESTKSMLVFTRYDRVEPTLVAARGLAGQVRSSRGPILEANDELLSVLDQLFDDYQLLIVPREE